MSHPRRRLDNGGRWLRFSSTKVPTKRNLRCFLFEWVPHVQTSSVQILRFDGFGFVDWSVHWIHGAPFLMVGFRGVEIDNFFSRTLASWRA